VLLVNKTLITGSDTSRSTSIAVIDNDNFYITWTASRLNFMKKYSIVRPTPPIFNDVQSNIPLVTESSVDNTMMIAIIVIGGVCLYGVCIFLVIYKRKRNVQSDEEHNLSPRIDKVRTILNGRFQSVDKISREEANLLENQCGIPIIFPEGRRKISYVAGEGNFAKVKLGYDITTNRMVGIKKVTDPLKLPGCKYETWIQQQLHHDNLLELLDSNTMDNSQGNKTLYIFFDLFMMDCDMLKIVLSENDELFYFKDIIIETIFNGIVSGVTYMHANKFYHRDIKPSNILVGLNGEVKIIDFGCSCRIEDGWMDKACGDMTRFSPECFELMRGEINMIPAEKVDAWAIGLAILEISTGKYPLGLVTVSELKLWKRYNFEERISLHAVVNNQNYALYESMISDLLNINCIDRPSVSDSEKLLVNTQSYSKEEIVRSFNTVQKVYHVRMLKTATSSSHRTNQSSTPDNDYQAESQEIDNNYQIEGIKPRDDYQIEGIKPRDDYQIEGIKPRNDYQIEGIEPRNDYQIEGIKPRDDYQIESINSSTDCQSCDTSKLHENYYLEGVDYSCIPSDYQV